MTPLFRLPIQRPIDREVDEELAFHLEMRAAALIALGWTPEAARAEAAREFGDLDDARTECRAADARREKRTMRTEYFTELRQDMAFAFRSLRRAPAFTAVAALTLALGIGANTAIFSVVRGILLRPLPFADPDRLVLVASSYQGRRFPYTSPANAADWQSENHSFTSLSVISQHSAVLTGAGEPEALDGAEVGGDFFDILGVQPVAGRLRFTPEETAFPAAKVVIVNEALWRTRFGADRSLVGRQIILDDERYQVVGVAPSQSTYPSGSAVWYPFAFDPARLASSRAAVYLGVIGRLKPGVSAASADLDMQALSARLEREYPAANQGMGAAVVPLQRWMTGSLDRPLLILLGGVGFILLIACANVANLLLARGVSREGELAVRRALGAGRGRLMRQLVTESLVLAGIGAAGGLALGAAGTRLLVGSAPGSIPRLGAIHLDGWVLAFTMIVAVIAGVGFGLGPARAMARPDLARTLRDVGRSGSGRASGNGVRRFLVIAEVALSVILLAGAGLLIRSFNRLLQVDPGFRTEGSVSFALSLPAAKYSSGERQTALVDALLARLRAIPGVHGADAGSALPLTPFRFNFSLQIAGKPVSPAGAEESAEVRVATSDFFRTMGMRIVRGRGFGPADRAGGQRVLLLNEAAARQLFPGEDPIGRHVRFGWGRASGPLEGDIVGVVGDVKQTSLARATMPEFWAPFEQWPVASVRIVIHTDRNREAVVSEARGIVRELDAALAVNQVKGLDEILSESVAESRFYMLLLAGFAVAAILLSAIGIYGVIAYLVGQRVREIGVRMALGASTGRVVRMVVREGALMAAAGLAAGTVGALLLTRLLGALLFEISTTDPVTYASVVGLLAAVALMASAIPAVRAARISPAITMRGD